MSDKLYKQSKRLEGRNGAIYKAKLAGCTAAEIAEAFNMSEANVYVKLKQVAASITPDEQSELRKIRSDFLDQLRQMAMEIALLDPAPAFAPNGKAHFDPATGKTVYDYGTRLNAIDRLLKIDERFGKLTGTDSAVQHTVQVSAEAEQATKDNAAKASVHLRNLFPPESAEVRAHAGSG